MESLDASEFEKIEMYQMQPRDCEVVPVPTKEAAENNVKLIRNPKAYKNIEVRENKEKGRWEVILIPSAS